MKEDSSSFSWLSRFFSQFCCCCKHQNVTPNLLAWFHKRRKVGSRANYEQCTEENNSCIRRDSCATGSDSGVAMTDCDVLILGAGPYGRAAAAHLRAIQGLDVRVFGEPMEFWKSHMPDGMLLRSPWAAS